MFKSLLFCLLLIQILNAEESLKKVTLQLSWFNQFQFAGYYVAKEQGFYKELGIDVDIKAFNLGIDVPQEIVHRNVDFAIGRETLIIEKAKNDDIISLYALFQNSPLVLLSLKNSNIDTINDFSNKTIMTTIDDAAEASLKAMISSHKIDFNNLIFIPHNHNINDLINKRTDVISAYLSKSPYELEKLGVEYNVFSPKDYGFDMYSDFLFTNKKLIFSDNELVMKFKEASLKGWEYAFNNIDESVNLILEKYNSQYLTKEELIYEAKQLKILAYENVDTLGKIDKNKVQRIHDLYNIMGLLPKKIDINDFVYEKNRFQNIFSSEEQQFIKSKPILKVGIRNDFKPFTFFNNLGEREGIIHDYLNLISEKTGLKFKYEINTEEELLKKLKNNEIDFIPILSNYEQLNDFKFSKPYFQTSANLLNVNHSNHLTDDVFKLKNLKELIDNKLSHLLIFKDLILSYLVNKKIINTNLILSPEKTEYHDIKMLFNKDNYILENIFSKALTITKEDANFIQDKWNLFIKENFSWFILNKIFFIFIIILFAVIYKQIALHRINQKLIKNKQELEVANLELKELAEKDALTKLYNRRFFMNIANNIILLEKREKRKTSLLMFDIDNFKKINDTYGHPIGDIVLSNLGKILLEYSRKSDVISRIGGEEFMILLPTTDLISAKKYSENLRKIIENSTIKTDYYEFNFTVSMGLTLIKSDDTLEKAINRVDKYLYQAKERGKNMIVSD
jgi:polar amino acid transport system substrate-binding protein